MSTNSKSDFINIITLGESSVGKSSIINRYVENNFDYNFVSTLGVDFRKKKYKYKWRRYKIENLGYCRTRKI